LKGTAQELTMYVGVGHLPAVDIEIAGNIGGFGR